LPSRSSALALSLAALFAASRAGVLPGGQGPVLDSGTLVISQGGSIVGRESFTLRAGHAGEPGGYTLSSSARYATAAGQVAFSPVVEWDSDSLPQLVQFDVYGDGQSRAYVRFGPRRVSVRIVRPGGESARELPAVGRELVVDDSVFALHALQPGTALSAIFPRTGTRVPVRLEDRGQEQAMLRGTARTLRHLVLHLGGQERHLWYDDGGRLIRVEIPVRGLSAERAPSP